MLKCFSLKLTCQNAHCIPALVQLKDDRKFVQHVDNAWTRSPIVCMHPKVCQNETLVRTLG